MTPEDPRHGSKRGYEAGCRLECCRRANTLYSNLLRLHGPRLVDITGTRRRVEALQVLGWSMTEQSRLLGHEPSYLRKAITTTRTGKVQQKTARAVADLYERLCMSVAHDPEQRRQGWNASRERTKRRALALGFVPPLGWDDIDDPDEVPHTPDTTVDLDPVVVERILAGDWRLSANRAERAEVVRRWTGSLNELERRTGWNVARTKRTEVA
jgi:hypothetical protein